MTGKSSLNSTGAFRDTFFAFGFLWICRTLPSLETKAQCFLHLISLFSVLIFSQARAGGWSQRTSNFHTKQSFMIWAIS
eukprot:Skav213243  [mRNA]  locus=scaffold2594:226158:228387:- [translate_table: standard]